MYKINVLGDTLPTTKLVRDVLAISSHLHHPATWQNYTAESANNLMGGDSLLLSVAVLLACLCRAALSTSCSDDGECQGEDHSPLSQALDPSERLIHEISDRTRTPQWIADSSEGIYVSVRTTPKYHRSRLPTILLSWMQTVSPAQVVGRGTGGGNLVGAAPSPIGKGLRMPD